MADAISFDPNVTITPDDKLVLTGSVNEPLRSFELLNTSDETLIGSPQITGSSWSYELEISSGQKDLLFTAAVTDTNGNSTAVVDDLSVITGITGNPFSTFVESISQDGSSATFKFYSDKGQLEYHTDATTGSDANHAILAMTGDQKNTQFVFTQNPRFAQTITNFHVDGTSHDALLLPHADFSTMADLLRDTTMSSGNAVIHDPNSSGTTLTLMGVTKAEMKAHHNDFSFHGSGGQIG